MAIGTEVAHNIGTNRLRSDLRGLGSVVLAIRPHRLPPRQSTRSVLGLGAEKTSNPLSDTSVGTRSRARLKAGSRSLQFRGRKGDDKELDPRPQLWHRIDDGVFPACVHVAVAALAKHKGLS